MLGEDKRFIEVYCKDVGVNPQKVELHLIVNHLHTVVVIQVHLILHV